MRKSRGECSIAACFMIIYDYDRPCEFRSIIHPSRHSVRWTRSATLASHRARILAHRRHSHRVSEFGIGRASVVARVSRTLESRVNCMNTFISFHLIPSRRSALVLSNSCGVIRTKKIIQLFYLQLLGTQLHNHGPRYRWKRGCYTKAIIEKEHIFRIGITITITKRAEDDSRFLSEKGCRCRCRCSPLIVSRTIHSQTQPGTSSCHCSEQ